MTKDEVVQKLARAGRLSIAHAEDLYDSLFEKPVVPQCVAKWYEGNKQNLDLNLSGLVFDLATNSTIYHQEELKAWVNSNKKTFITTLVNMHQFGYEVEKKPKYTVRVKGIKRDKQWLVFSELTERWWFGTKEDSHYAVLEHTHKELEANGFGWVFDCPGVEVKEVE